MIRFRTDMLQIDTMQALEIAGNGDHYIVKASGQGRRRDGPRIPTLCDLPEQGHFQN